MLGIGVYTLKSVTLTSCVWENVWLTNANAFLSRSVKLYGISIVLISMNPPFTKWCNLKRNSARIPGSDSAELVDKSCWSAAEIPPTKSKILAVWRGCKVLKRLIEDLAHMLIWKRLSLTKIKQAYQDCAGDINSRVTGRCRYNFNAYWTATACAFPVVCWSKAEIPLFRGRGVSERIWIRQYYLRSLRSTAARQNIPRSLLEHGGNPFPCTGLRGFSIQR